MNTSTNSTDRLTRRDFLKTSTATAVGGALAVQVAAETHAHAAGGETLRVGLIGCGGRGTGAASQAMRADPSVKLTAMGDLFEDRLQDSLAHLRAVTEIAGKIEVKPDQCFVGFDAYQRVIASGVDVVLLCTPPGFRPLHLKAAIDAGKHVFAEKPVAVDAPGVRSVIATCAEAKKKKLSVVSGLCLRYSDAHREMMKRLHDGAIGDLVTLQANDYRGTIWEKPRQPGWTDMHFQTRNWYYFTYLSGDFNVEQHVHLLDVCAWAMRGEYPTLVVGTGGRQVRVGPQYGNIYDHFSVTYEYANGVKLFSNCRQMQGCKNDITAYAAGTKGRAVISERGMQISGPNEWRTRGQDNEFYLAEHNELFAGIRSGQPINNGDYMAKSTLLAIMGRMAAYTGQQITWEMAMNSQEDLTPPKYEWGPIATPAVAVPGVTRFV